LVGTGVFVGGGVLVGTGVFVGTGVKVGVIVGVNVGRGVAVGRGVGVAAARSPPSLMPESRLESSEQLQEQPKILPKANNPTSSAIV